MDEIEIKGKDEDEFELIPLSPIRRLEDKIKNMEDVYKYTGLPQIQSLIMQIIELIRNNQKIVDDLVKTNVDLRNEIAKLPPKIDDLVLQMKSFMDLVRMAGEESEVSIPSDMMKPVTEQLQKMVEQNQKVLESNQEMLNSMEEINKKIRTGTPVSQLLSSYPRINIRSLQRQ